MVNEASHRKHESQPSELDAIKQYVVSVRWKFASTYAEKAPHWYTVRDWNPDKRGQFAHFVEYIREAGYNRPFYGRPFTYLDVDDYYYWTMGEPIENTEVINRAIIVGAPDYKMRPSQISRHFRGRPKEMWHNEAIGGTHDHLGEN